MDADKQKRINELTKLLAEEKRDHRELIAQQEGLDDEIFLCANEISRLTAENERLKSQGCPG